MEEGPRRYRLTLAKMLLGVAVACAIFALVAYVHRRTGNLFGSAVLVGILILIVVAWLWIEAAIFGTAIDLADRAIHWIFGVKRDSNDGDA